MGRARRPVRTLVSVGSALFALATAALLVVPSGAFAGGRDPPVALALVNCSGASSSDGVVATLTWDGTNVCDATNQSAALSVDFTNTANLTYSWQTTGSTAVTLNDARLEMFYFGFSLVTRDVTVTNPTAQNGGQFFMNWNPGALTYVFEGLFRLTASILAANGTTVWSENFYIRATAPYAILAALPIVLILIAIWELYSVARSGRQAALSSKPSAPSAPAKPPSEPPASTPSSESPAPAPAEGEAPPTEGSS